MSRMGTSQINLRPGIPRLDREVATELPVGSNLNSLFRWTGVRTAAGDKWDPTRLPYLTNSLHALRHATLCEIAESYRS